MKKLKTYTLRTLIFGGAGLLLLYIFIPNDSLEQSFAFIEKSFPKQNLTSTLYKWKLEYFPAGNKKSKQEKKQEAEQEFEVDNVNSSKPTKNTQKNKEEPDGLEIPKSPYKDEIIKHNYYTLAYCEKYEQARWVAYKMTPKNLEKNVNRSDERFFPDSKVSTGSASPQDYAGSGYDRGHLAPAGDFTGSAKMMHETFSMSNMSPQHPLCNRETWRLLEEQTRRWGEKKGNLYIVTGPIFKPNMPTIGKKNKIAVPPAYYKIIFSYKEMRAIAFIVPNVNKKENYKRYQVSIREVEKETGLDFFHLLPDDIEEALESSTSTEGWFAPKKKKNE
mgnify:CR=1 FL=1